MASSSGKPCRMAAHMFCREHPDAILVEDYHAGDMICPMCGLVVGDRFKQRADWFEKFRSSFATSMVVVDPFRK